ncbi:hypothetical protein PAXINDRAFT_166448 [Paxillus involutus ATCC 200175]|nr:hypothetical protein PAXINDRAFT_166448 [Paxillus involutus ATCC 200175]
MKYSPQQCSADGCPTSECPHQRSPCRVRRASDLDVGLGVRLTGGSSGYGVYSVDVREDRMGR